MSTGYYIAGAIFLALSIIWWVISKFDKRKRSYDKAIKDLDNAIDAHDWDAIDDARRRLFKNK